MSSIIFFKSPEFWAFSATIMLLWNTGVSAQEIQNCSKNNFEDRLKKKTRTGIPSYACQDA